MESPSRRDMLTAAAVTVSLPLVQAALGRLESARAADAGADAPAPAGAAPARGNNTPEPAGWLDTGVKPADVKDNQFTAVNGHKVLLARQGDHVSALTNVCTHKGCLVAPKGAIGACPCHGAQYALDGSVTKGPATKALNHYAVRLTAKGTIEVDPGQTLAKDAKEAILTSKLPAATQAA